MTNHYQILGVPTNATTEQIKVAYREYAKNFHPDKHSNSEFFKRRFQDIQSAYEVLSNAEARMVFDKQNLNGRTAYDATIDKLKGKVEMLTMDLIQNQQVLKNKEADLNRVLVNNRELAAEVQYLKSNLNSIAHNKNYASAPSAKYITNLKFGLFISIFFIFVLMMIIFAIAIQEQDKVEKAVENKDKIVMSKVYRSIEVMDIANHYSQMISLSDSMLHSDAALDTSHSAIYRANSEHKAVRRLERADLLSIRGYGKFKIDNDSGAIRDFTLSILNRKLPSAHPYLLRYAVKNKMGDVQGAMADINESIRLSPTFTDARFQRGNLFYDSQQYELALRDYKVIDMNDPRNAVNLNSLGDCYHHLNKPDSACIMWRKAGDFGSTEAFESIKKYCK